MFFTNSKAKKQLCEIVSKNNNYTIITRYRMITEHFFFECFVGAKASR